jgi:predicted RNA-binding Zn-ribbon protein involved in translation (DUF1610 family)
MTRDQLVDLSIADRDRKLLSLREQTLGPELEGQASCPQCGERLEFSVRTTDFQASLRAQAEPGGQTLEVGEIKLHFRLPTSRDLAAVAVANEVERSRRLLAIRCVTGVTGVGAPGDAPRAQANDQAVALAELPDNVIGALSARMAEADPQSEILLDFTCPACGREWRNALDIASWFWTEIKALAKRLLREVHVLARAYGWREQDILAMSAARRQAYLDMA